MHQVVRMPSSDAAVRYMPDFRAELRISPGPVLVLLIALATLFGFGVDLSLLSSRGMDMVLFTWAVALISWLLGNWQGEVGRWATVTSLAMVLIMARLWLNAPGIFALLIIPTLLGTLLVGINATLLTAGAQTLLLLSLLLARPEIDHFEIIIALIAIWSAVVIASVLSRRACGLASRFWIHFQDACLLVDEARNRQAELKQALDDLAHMNQQLAMAGERLATLRLIAEEAEKTKRAFVAKVSHEFRTPLNMIIGLADLLVAAPKTYGRELPQDVLADIAIIQRNCEHLAKLVNDVLDLSQIEAGRFALHKERVDLGEIVAESLDVVRPLIARKHIQLTVDIPPSLPLVYCDRTRIRQTVVNLVSNAARFTEQGSIAIQVKASEQDMLLSVTDTGPGIASEDIEHIFEPFSAGIGRLWQDKSGSGLGLAISKQFIELHGGRIWLQSSLGQGSTFSFALPISGPIGPAARPERWISEQWKWVERSQRRGLATADAAPHVVMYDDTNELLDLLARYSDEIRFICAHSLADITQQVHQNHARALLVNTSSPTQLLSLVDMVRSQVPDTPIVGCALPYRTDIALMAGATAYLVKPVSSERLSQAIRRTVGTVRRVLIIDDDSDALYLFSRMLRAHDQSIEIRTAINGVEGLNQMHIWHPNLVLLDLILPGMDGRQLLATKAGDENIRDIPVIIISAQDPQQPLESPVLMAAMGEGLSVSRLLRCLREIPGLFLQPD